MAGWFVVDNSQDEALLSSSKRSLPAPESIGTTMMMRDNSRSVRRSMVAADALPAPERSTSSGEERKGILDFYQLF